jgi:S-adenosylmethionine:tRNA ribosyltransferase-isomerase
MKLSDFNYELPEHLIARYPLARRSDSRLMVIDRQHAAITHTVFHQLLNYLQAGDLLLFNDTKVIPARLEGRKISGGKVELLIERIVDAQHASVQIASNKPVKIDSQLLIADRWLVTVVSKAEGFYELRFPEGVTVYEVMAQVGEIPIPPYFKRRAESIDKERYQTCYAREPGAVAAPTAGLHFDEPLLAALKEKGVSFAYLTLHVGAGTFQPLRCENIAEHVMHSETIDVGAATIAAIAECKQRNGRVIAVGTTSVRAIESIAERGPLAPFCGDVAIFITPGFQFKVIDALITNFHLPQSTLLMLVSAFAGHELMLKAYRIAVAEQYRFFSYGDAMFIG